MKEIVITVDKIPSVNNYKECKCVKGGRIIGYYITPVVKKFKKMVKEQLQNYSIDEIPNKLQIVFFLKQNISRRDVSNLVKALEDSVAESFKVDDSKWVILEIMKIKSPDKNEYIAIRFYDKLGKIINIKEEA